MPSPTQLDIFGGSTVCGSPRTFAIAATGAIWCNSCRESHEPTMLGTETEYAYSRPDDADAMGWEHEPRFSRWSRIVTVWQSCRWCEFVCSCCDELRHRDDSYQCSRCESCDSCCDCAYCEGCDESHDPYDMCRDCSSCSSCCSCEPEDCDCDSCYEQRGYDCDDSEDVETVATYDTGALLAVGRTFGVELECVGISPRRAAAAIAAANLPTAGFVGYRHDMCHVWKVVTDSSVNGGCEVVSPILRGEDGFEQMRVAMLALSANGATVDRQCGTHVHHGMPDATGPELARVVKFYDAAHAAIDTMHPVSRRGRSDWAGPTTASLSELEGSATSSAAKDAAYRLPRYCSVNVTAFPKYETVEFRQHAGTLDYVRLAAWVRFGQALIASALSGRIGTDNLATLLDMLDIPEGDRSALLADA